MKEKEDYYDDEFDQTVKMEIESTKFKDMTDAEKLEMLNKERNEDFTNMRGKIDGDSIDMMSKK